VGGARQCCRASRVHAQRPIQLDTRSLGAIQMTELEVIEVVLKVTERCNINCDYCYMFNMGNDDYKRLPKRIALSTVHSLANFLRGAVTTNRVGLVKIILHGGEPMMMPKAQLRKLCEVLVSAFAGTETRVQF